MMVTMAINTPRKLGMVEGDPQELTEQPERSDVLLTPRFDLTPYARRASGAEALGPSEAETEETRRAALRMFDRLNADDHLGALDEAETLLALNPRHGLGNACATECRSKLEEEFALYLSAEVVPQPLRSAHLTARLDHREGFLFSLVDGTLTVEVLHDISGMTLFEVQRALAKLARLGVIALG